jgi:hypothetical protein
MYLDERERAELVTQLSELLEQRDEYASIKIYSVGPEKRDTTLGEDPTKDPANVV